MPIAVLLAAVVVGGVVWFRRGRGDTDGPGRTVTVAASWMPAHRRDWGRGMQAELAQVTGRGRRWRFAAGAVRVMLLPPLERPRRVLAVAGAGALFAAAGTSAAVREVPSVAVFVGTLGLLLCGYATARTARARRPRLGVPHVLVTFTALAGLAGTLVTVLRIAAAHPAATTDHSHHVVSIVLAILLTGYVAFTTSRPRLGGSSDAVRRWALVAAAAGGVMWTVLAATTPAQPGIASFLDPVGAGVTLLAALGASVSTRSRRAGVEAGLLGVVLAAPIRFTVDMTTLLHMHRFTLTSRYDVAAYPHSGYPDVASYVLGDALDGNILVVLLGYPVTLAALAVVGVIAWRGIHDLVTGRAAV